MVELFGKRLDEVEKQGAWALIRLSSQEVGHWPSSAHYLTAGLGSKHSVEQLTVATILPVFCACLSPTRI